MSSLLWVAVPGGRLENGTAVLRALVVPRITGAEDRTLGETELSDWPAVLAGSALTVETAADGTAEPQPVPDAARHDGEHMDATLWKRILPPELPVRPWRQPSEDRQLEVEHTTRDHEALVRLYRESAKVVGDPTQVANGLAAADLGPPARQDGPLPLRGDAPPQTPEFHQVVSLLREHSRVLRALGLIVEFTLPADRLAPSGVVRVACRPAPDAPPLETVSPWTRYLLDPYRFLPAPAADSDLVAGLVDLAHAHWTLATFDVAGGIARVRDAAKTQGEQPARPDAPERSAVALPPLRSAGLSLLRADRARVFDSRREAAAANRRLAAEESLHRAELTADDLVLGYRVDVRTSDRDWRSLCRRLARYYSTGNQEVEPEFEEEGQVKTNGASVSDRNLLRADEVVVRWNGWSLTCPSPLDRSVRDRADGAADRNRLRFIGWDFTPIELPELRFGREYRMRVRTADIAGGGLRHDDPEIAEGQSATVFYGRHDPVPPPEVLPQDAAPPGPGVQADEIVIRSDPAAVSAPPGDLGASPADGGKLLLPPPASFVLADQHGAFDGRPVATCVDWVGRATSPPGYGPDGSFSWLPDPAAEGVAVRLRPAPGTHFDDPEPDKEAWTVPEGAWPDLPAKWLRLQPAAEGRPVLERVEDGRAFIVRLAPGQQAYLEVASSVVGDDLDKFAVHQWLSRPQDGTAPDGEPLSDELLTHLFAQIRDGLHPMVSPTRRLHLVHAVRRPLQPPGGPDGIKLTATRNAGETVAVIGALDPNADRLLGLHPPSTAQLDLDAAWSETNDHEWSGRSARVLSRALDPDATSLAPLRHEFGDTRYRRVAYTMTALSRFRSYFPPGDDGLFAASRTFGEVDVLSSARPEPPHVLSVAPVLTWGGERHTLAEGATPVVSVRRGGELRVELERPWNTSGEGELLAVLIQPGPDNPAIDRRYVTRVRRDPVRATPDPVGDPPPSAFRGNLLYPTPLGAPLPGLITEPLAETGQPVGVVLYTPGYVGDATSGRWLADVAMPGVAGDSYCPFVQLALARLQQMSIEPLYLSTVVRTDLVPLLPERTLTVRRADGAVYVLLTGLGPDGPELNQVSATLEGLPAGVRAENVDLSAASGSPTPGVPAWRPLATTAASLNTPLPPLPLAGAGGPLRLVVRETEALPSTLHEESVRGELTERTVYLDILALDGQ